MDSTRDLDNLLVNALKEREGKPKEILDMWRRCSENEREFLIRHQYAQNNLLNAACQLGNEAWVTELMKEIKKVSTEGDLPDIRLSYVGKGNTATNRLISYYNNEKESGELKIGHASFGNEQVRPIPDTFLSEISVQAIAEKKHAEELKQSQAAEALAQQAERSKEEAEQFAAKYEKNCGSQHQQNSTYQLWELLQKKSSPNVQAVQTLLNKGANPGLSRSATISNSSPALLQIAIKNGHTNVAGILRAHTADPTVRKNTPMNWFEKYIPILGGISMRIRAWLENYDEGAGLGPIARAAYKANFLSSGKSGAGAEEKGSPPRPPQYDDPKEKKHESRGINPPEDKQDGPGPSRALTKDSPSLKR